MEVEILQNGFMGTKSIHRVELNIFQEMREKILSVHTSEALLYYIRDLVAYTRRSEMSSEIVSPLSIRSSLAIKEYAQGFAMMTAAAGEFGWALDMPRVARVWRAGCIIRSAMLNDMAEALSQDPGRNLMLAPFFADHLRRSLPALRRVVAAGALHGLGLPALSAGLAWFDLMRTARGTANMIQGQRDFFGLHGFQRLDGLDQPHGPWAHH